MRQWILLLIGLWSCAGVAAQGYQFELKGRNDIDQEILVAEVVSFHQFLGGSISVQWYLNDADALAERLKQRLINAGISPNRVLLQKNRRRTRPLRLHWPVSPLIPKKMMRCVSRGKVLTSLTVIRSSDVR